MRFAVLVAIVLLGCGSTPPPDRPFPDDLDLEDGPFSRRDAQPQPLAGATDAGASASAPTPSLKVEVVSDPAEPAARIDLAVRDASVRDVLRMIATAANVGLVVSDEVTGNVTLEVDNVTWRQAIDVIAHLENLVVTEVNGVVLVKQQP